MTLALSHSDVVTPVMISTLFACLLHREKFLTQVNNVSITFKQDLGFSLNGFLWANYGF